MCLGIYRLGPKFPVYSILFFFFFYQKQYIQGMYQTYKISTFVVKVLLSQEENFISCGRVLVACR